MKAETKWEAFVGRITSFFRHWYLRLTCPHGHITTLATFDTLSGPRFSGFAVCRCGMDFIVNIAADEEERKSEHYLGY